MILYWYRWSIRIWQEGKVRYTGIAWCNPPYTLSFPSMYCMRKVGSYRATRIGHSPKIPDQSLLGGYADIPEEWLPCCADSKPRRSTGRCRYVVGIMWWDNMWRNTSDEDAEERMNRSASGNVGRGWDLNGISTPNIEARAFNLFDLLNCSISRQRIDQDKKNRIRWG